MLDREKQRPLRQAIIPEAAVFGGDRDGLALPITRLETAMTYFQAFLEAQDTNWFSDDPLLHKLLRRYAPEATAEEDAALTAWGETVASRLRCAAEESALPANAPYLRHFDAHNRRVDEVVLPSSTLQALAEVQGARRLGALHGDPFVFYSMVYLYNQNGEGGVGCSTACTDGMVRLLEAVGDRPEHRIAIERVRGSSTERVCHGAQFVTEIQAGSDVPAIGLEARPCSDGHTLHGQKWFCSNVNADYFVVAGRPSGAPPGGRGVGVFLVPAYVDGKRNGYTIDRLKDKLGTRELATAEVTFDGARAYGIGPLDRGLANLVDPVLTTSRFHCINVAAGSLRRAERIVSAYVRFREAFGKRLVEHELVRAALDDLGHARALALGIVFELIRLWHGPSGSGQTQLDFRLLLSLCKPVLTRRSTAMLHEALMLLGGNGLEERFSALPRLYRDAVIMETWEGPHNVLLTQALRDMVRFEVDPADLVERLAGVPRPDLADELARILGAPDEPGALTSFTGLAGRLVQALGERLLADAGWTDGPEASGA